MNGRNMIEAWRPPKRRCDHASGDDQAGAQIDHLRFNRQKSRLPSQRLSLTEHAFAPPKMSKLHREAPAHCQSSESCSAARSANVRNG